MSEARIGVYVCNCGTNIANMVDADAVIAAVEKLPGVAVARSYRYMCSNPGQEMVAADIKEHDLDRVVVAACSPRMHEPTFRKALSSAGLNPYFLEMANIREQCSWVHEDRDAATLKATALTRGAIQRVLLHEPLEKREVPMHPATLVLGGGIAGISAALELAGAGQPVYLVEQNDHLGGNLARVDLTAPHFGSARDMVEERLARVASSSEIEVLLESKLTQLEGFVGNFRATIQNGESQRAVDVGSVIVCTGYKEFDAARVARFGYGRLPGVITSFELERMLREGKVELEDGRTPRYVALVHCVGSRSEEFHSYCSRVCCMTALKYAQEIKSAVPECAVSNLYVDMHAFGKGCEDFYRRSSEIRTLFLMYPKNTVPTIKRASAKDGCELLISLGEVLSGETVEVPADLVVLMVGMEPRKDAGQVAHLVNISRDKDGWFIESHPKLDPVATTTEGVFIAGACQAPKDIPDSVAQARAAAARILTRIARGKIEVDAVYAEVDEEACSGCRMCNELCPYGAIEYDDQRARSKVISALCKACGTCVAGCPSSAISGRHFTEEQLYAQIEGVLA